MAHSSSGLSCRQGLEVESTEGQECAPTSSPLAAPSGATSQSPPGGQARVVSTRIGGCVRCLPGFPELRTQDGRVTDMH